MLFIFFHYFEQVNHATHNTPTLYHTLIQCSIFMCCTFAMITLQ